MPDLLNPPATESAFLKALGRGKQGSACQANPQNPSKYEWVLEKPQAEFLDDHAGPWTPLRGAYLGSHRRHQSSGRSPTKCRGPGGNAVPWLLLKAKTASTEGTFAHVTYIQRVNTKGGFTPTAGCDKAHSGKEVAIDYQANCYFYAQRR